MYMIRYNYSVILMAKFFICFLGLVAGIAGGIYSEKFLPFTQPQPKEPIRKQIIGFLPYWLLDTASPNEVEKLTTLTYFGVDVDENGHIVKLASPQEEDPSWNALHSGRVDPFL